MNFVHIPLIQPGLRIATHTGSNTSGVGCFVRVEVVGSNAYAPHEAPHESGSPRLHYQVCYTGTELGMVSSPSGFGTYQRN